MYVRACVRARAGSALKCGCDLREGEEHGNGPPEAAALCDAAVDEAAEPRREKEARVGKDRVAHLCLQQNGQEGLVFLCCGQ